ncbi:NifU-like protein 4, mitochondrial, partial [Tetrabaena socialis]
GYAVVDGVFGRDMARRLRSEVVDLYERGLMHKNCTHLVKNNTTALLEKSQIHEAELTLDSDIQSAAPLCSSLNSDHTLATMLSLLMPQLALDGQAIKLQYNAGSGGCFPLHYDSDEQLDGRRVTAIFYLNPGWTEAQGGQLRLYPFPAPPLDVAPLEDRLVLFASTRMLHRVLPSTAPSRCCFTIWLSQVRRRALVRQAPSLASLEPSGSPSDDPQAAVRFLMHPLLRQHVSKYVYASEWTRSLEESHADSEARSAMLEQHHKEVALIQRSLGKYLGVMDQLGWSLALVCANGLSRSVSASVFVRIVQILWWGRGSASASIGWTFSMTRITRYAGRLLGGLHRTGATAEAVAVALPQMAALHYAASSSPLARASGVASTSGMDGMTRMWPWHSAAGQKRGMFIQTQPTPNPNSLMFVPDRSVMESGTLEFSSARESMKSPLAKKLFAVDGISSVFFGSDFITVTKKDEYSWPVLKPDIFAAIMDFYSSGELLITGEQALACSDTAIHEDDSEVVAMIKELLETRIRPAVQEDGGDIQFKGFEEDTGTVLVKLVGACSTCPSSTVTLKSGIENMLMHYIPEVKSVIEAPPDETEEEGVKEFAKFEKSIGATDEEGTKEVNPMAAHLSA